MANLARGRYRGARSGKVKALADVPRACQLLGLQLQIAPGHIEANSVSIDVAERIFNTNVRAAFAYGRHEFELVMHIAGRARIGKIPALRQQGPAGLEKKEQIGRASCRERGESKVGAVALKE